MVTYEEARQFLENGRELSRQLDNKLVQWEYLNDQAKRVTTILTGMPRSGGLSEGSSSMENACVAMIALVDQVGMCASRLIVARKKICDVLDQIVSDKYKLVLEDRYIACMSWRDIFKAMKMSKSQVMAVHNKGIQIVQTLLPGERNEPKG